MGRCIFPYHAAPTTESPMQREMPMLAQPTGEMDSRNAPTWTDMLLDDCVVSRIGGGFFVLVSRFDVH